MWQTRIPTEPHHFLEYPSTNLQGRRPDSGLAVPLPLIFGACGLHTISAVPPHTYTSPEGLFFFFFGIWFCCPSSEVTRHARLRYNYIYGVRPQKVSSPPGHCAGKPVVMSRPLFPASLVRMGGGEGVKGNQWAIPPMNPRQKRQQGHF